MMRVLPIGDRPCAIFERRDEPSSDSSVSKFTPAILALVKIVVAIKQVPARDSQLRVDDTRALDPRERSELRNQRARRIRA